MLGTLPSKAKRRFNLLLLEEKEYYFEDHGAFLYLPPDNSSQVAATQHSTAQRSAVQAIAHHSLALFDCSLLPSPSRVSVCSRHLPSSVEGSAAHLQ